MLLTWKIMYATWNQTLITDAITTKSSSSWLFVRNVELIKKLWKCKLLNNSFSTYVTTQSQENIPEQKIFESLTYGQYSRVWTSFGQSMFETETAIHWSTGCIHLLWNALFCPTSKNICNLGARQADYRQLCDGYFFGEGRPYLTEALWCKRCSERILNSKLSLNAKNEISPLQWYKFFDVPRIFWLS